MRGGQSFAARFFQICVAVRVNAQGAAGVFVFAGPADRAAHRHLVLHLPEHVLCHRHLPPQLRAAKERDHVRNLRRAVPAADCRSDCTLRRRGKAAAAPHPLSAALYERRAAVPVRTLRKSAARERPREHLGPVQGGRRGQSDADGMGRHPRVHLSDFL